MRVYQIRTPKKRSFFTSLSMTNRLLIINILFFIITLILAFIDKNLWNYLVLNPSTFVNKLYLWTIITSMFMHGGFAHLFVNMLSLLFIGNFIEKLIGTKRFLWFYLISGIIAGLFFVFGSILLGNSSFFGTGFDISAVGASGAIFGIAGLLMILTPNLPLYIMFIPIPIKAKYAVPGILIIIALISGVADAAIGNMAHLGGLIAGVAYGIYLIKKKPRKARAIRNYFK